MGVSNTLLLTLYKQQVRCMIEQNVAIWNGALRCLEISNIERVQKTACHIMLGQDYTSYKDACAVLGLKTLRERRLELCLKFARRMAKHELYKDWFYPRVDTRPRAARRLDHEKPYLDVPCRTKAYYDSTIPYIVRLLNRPPPRDAPGGGADVPAGAPIPVIPDSGDGVEEEEEDGWVEDDEWEGGGDEEEEDDGSDATWRPYHYG